MIVIVIIKKNSDKTTLLSDLNDACYYGTMAGECSRAANVSGRAWVIKINKRVGYFTMNLLTTAAITNGTICTIPDGWRPASAVSTFGFQANATSRTVTLNTNGTVTGTMSASTCLHCNAVYNISGYKETPWTV